jgi:putative tricarboxylic transport membrane protein
LIRSKGAKSLMNSRRHFLLLLTLTGLAALLLPAARGQSKSFQPQRTVDVVVHTGPGGGSDLFARAIAGMLRKENLLPQPLQVINKPGGSGAVAMAYLATKKGDAHTIGFFTDVWVTTPLVQSEARFTLKDLTPIALIIREPGAAVVRSQSPFNTMEQFVKAAQKTPGQLRQAGGSVTSVDNLIRLLIQKASGSAWTFISFPSGGERTAALLGGHADLMLTQLQEVREQLRAGRLRVIATLGDQRTSSLPNVPTLKEQGINIPSLVQFRGVLAPPGVPPEVVQYWENLIRRLMATETWKKYARDEGLEEAYLDSRALIKFWDDQTALMRRSLSEGTQLKLR